MSFQEFPFPKLDIDGIIALVNVWTDDSTIQIRRIWNTLHRNPESGGRVVHQWEEASYKALAVADHLERKAAEIRQRVHDAKLLLVESITKEPEA